MFNFFKKNQPKEVEGSVKFVVDEKGDKYLHIKQFKKVVEDFKNVYSDPSVISALNSIIETLDINE